MNMDSPTNKYRNESTRLKKRDYGAPGIYFITLCTQYRQNYLGRIECNVPLGSNVGTQNFAFLQDNISVDLTRMGNIAHQYWMEIPNHFPFVILDEFIVMPDHVHGLLQIYKPGYRDYQSNTFGPQSQNLASVIRGYKAAVKKYATLNDLEFTWQPRYHERIIRTNEMNTIRNYIKDNP